MKGVFHSLSILVALISMGIQGLAQQSEKINWTENQQFDWDMFEEKKKSYGFIKAMTYSGISYDVEMVNNKIQIDVKAYFIYGKSWVMKGYKKPHLLAHEKAHFDIAEIFKRRLDKLYDRYRVDYDTFIKRDYQEALQRDFDMIFKKMDDYQKKYDEQTQHGTKKNMQLKWESDLQKILTDSKN